jgi:UDP-N-acetylglucosamine:LPS N-acetylglucosamine transferase
LLGLPEDRSTVAIFGGSLGARTINRAATGLVDRWGDRTDRSVYHIVGQRDWEELAPSGTDGGDPARSGDGLAVITVPYEERMGVVYTAADVVVCRAGAMTVAELAVAGVPSILVPLPGAPGDHQTANARVLQRAGAAILLADADCDAEALDVTLSGMLVDPSGLDAMGRAASSLGRHDAAAAGAQVVEAHARPRRMRSST